MNSNQYEEKYVNGLNLGNLKYKIIKKHYLNQSFEKKWRFNEEYILDFYSTIIIIIDLFITQKVSFYLYVRLYMIYREACELLELDKNFSQVELKKAL